jgi:uncharacterized membrane protein YgcG
VPRLTRKVDPFTGCCQAQSVEPAAGLPDALAGPKHQARRGFTGFDFLAAAAQVRLDRPHTFYALSWKAPMRRLLLALAIALVLPSKAWATWSIIAIDRATGRVVISSSTCAANAPDNLKLLQAIVIPGVGVAAAQAGVDGTHANQKLIFEQMRMGTDPKQIIEMLKQDPSIQSRQFGILDMQGRMAGFSGSSNGNFSRDYQGTSDDGKLYYAVQGNIIKTEEALIEAAQLMKTDRSEMLDRVMLAMEKANSLGGDSRCTCTSGSGGPIPGLPCTNRTTSVGYILAADPTDARGQYAELHPQIPGNNLLPNNQRDLRAPWNDGDYYLYIAVYPGNFRPNEDAAPVCTLRLRYDAWVAQGRPRMNLKAPPVLAARMQQPPPPPAVEGAAAAAGRGGGGGRGGGAAPTGRGGGGGGGGGGRAAAPPPAPYTGPTTAACARSASALPPTGQDQAQAAPTVQRAADPRRVTGR